MIVVLCRRSACRIPHRNIVSQERLKHFRHARSISPGCSFCKPEAVSGEGTILTREPRLNAASESSPNFFIRDAEQIFLVADRLRNGEVAGEEEQPSRSLQIYDD